MIKKINEKDILFICNSLNVKAELKKKLWKKLFLTEEDIMYLWDLLTDEVGTEFDENYKLTQRGKIIEMLIDKFYEMGENFNPEQQYVHNE